MQQPLRAQLISTWAAWLHCPPVALWRPGTTVRADHRRGPSDAVQLWPVTPEHVLAEVMPALVEPVTTLLTRRPVGHRLTADDLLLGLGRTMVAWDRVRVLAFEPGRAAVAAEPAPRRRWGRVTSPGGPTPVMAPAGTTRRLLGPADHDVLDALLRRCYKQERIDADVGIGGEHLVAVGILDGSRMLAVASAATWRGFADLGVITDPAARGRGAARAAVLAVVDELARTGPPPRPVVLYRYSVDNAGSHALAGSLPLVFVGEGETVRLRDGQ